MCLFIYFSFGMCPFCDNGCFTEEGRVVLRPSPTLTAIVGNGDLDVKYSSIKIKFHFPQSPSLNEPNWVSVIDVHILNPVNLIDDTRCQRSSCLILHYQGFNI